MGFSSQSGALIARTQTVKGTFNADTEDEGVGILLRSGGLGMSRELMIPDPEIGGGRDTVDAYLGAIAWSGDYELYARADAIATLLRACLGSAAAPAVAAGVTTHVLTPSNAAQLPFLSLHERIGAGLEYFNYTDAVVNTFHLEADANGYLQATAGIIAAKQEAGVGELVPVYDNTPMYVGTNVAVTYNGVTLPAKSFSLDINNNFADDDFRLGSFFIGDLTPGAREVTAGFSIRESSSALWRQAVYGVGSATSPGGQTTKSGLVITASSYEFIGATTTPYSLRFEFPKFILSPYALAQSGADIIESDIEGRAVTLAANPVVTATIKTGKATIS